MAHSVNTVDIDEKRESKRMPVLIASALIVIAFAVGACLYWIAEHEPKQLGYWLNKASTRDWTSEAAAGKPEAQLCVGLNLIRTNLIVMIDRVPALASVPVIGKPFFEKIHYSLDNKISPERQILAYGYINKAHEQGFAPALKAEALFAGRMASLRAAGNNSTNTQQVGFTNGSGQTRQ